MNFILLKLTVTLSIVLLITRLASAQTIGIPTGAERQEILDAHNQARSEVAQRRGVPYMAALTWNDAAAEHGRQWLQSQGCRFDHSDSYAAGFGENLAAGQRPWHAAIYDAWHASEESCYGPPRQGCTYGHYTAVNWNTTTSVGCARCEGSGVPYGLVQICNYSPPGNNRRGQEAFEEGGQPCSRCDSARPNCASVCPGCPATLCTDGAGSTTQPPQTTTTQPRTTTTQPRATTTQPRATTTQPRATTTQPRATTTQPTRPTEGPSDPDMVLEFTLRVAYQSITDFAGIEANVLDQLERYFGLPKSRTSVEFLPHSNPSYTRLIVTVAGASSRDEPTAASMGEAVNNSDGLDNLGALDVNCVSNCGTMSEPANLAAASGSNTGLIVGVIVGAIVVLTAIGLGAYCFLKKRKEKNYLDNMASDSQMSASGQVRSGAFA